METEPSLDERIIQLFRHLGVARAHVGASVLPDWQGLATKYSDLVASLTLVCPLALDPSDLLAVASRLLVFTGDQGARPERLRSSLAGLRDATLITLPDCLGETWSDVAADRTHEVGTSMLEFLRRVDAHDPVKAAALTEHEGEVAGIDYRVRGAGRPLVLFPMALAPSQWEPLIPMLATHYCTITLGGAVLGTVPYLEARGRLGYIDAVRSLIQAARVRPGDEVVEIGCGSGVLLRWLAHQTERANRIVGVDINRYLLREAAALVERDKLNDTITLREGNAEALPLSDRSADVVFACT